MSFLEVGISSISLLYTTNLQFGTWVKTLSILFLLAFGNGFLLFIAEHMKELVLIKKAF